MAQVLVNFRMDSEDKNGMEEVCKELGLSMTTAFTIFAKKMGQAVKNRRQRPATAQGCAGFLSAMLHECYQFSRVDDTKEKIWAIGQQLQTVDGA